MVIILNNLTALREIVPDSHQDFVDSLQALKNVKDACFGKDLDENYKTIIQQFEDQWMKLYLNFNFSWPNKVHIICHHIPQVLEKTGKSLFLSSEQVVEASHAKFAEFWDRYNVLDLERPMHGDNLKECIKEFNSVNV